jgi:branched-chain amino acid transport system ATP-binding protein
MSGAGTVLLRATSIAVTYRGGAVGVRNIDLQLEKGELLAIVGPNGAGKSSTLRGLGGFLKSEGARIEGEVLLRSRSVAEWEPHRRTSLGLFSINERRKVFSNLSVRDNLMAVQGPKGRAGRLQRFDEAIALFPVLRERLDDAAGLLSGGQQQMLAIARAFMLDADVLLIDEMTLGIHQSIRPGLFEAVRVWVNNGRAAIVVDESVNLIVDYADRLIALANGGIVATGTPQELRESTLLDRVYSGDLT